MEIERNLNWYPDFKSNQIDIKDGCFNITIEKDMIEIECDWDYGYGGRGTERMYISIEKLKELIKELEDSHL